MTSISSVRESFELGKNLLASELRVQISFLLLLGEQDTQRAYLELGYRSAWDLVRRGYKQSERMTFYRLNAARVLARFPHAVELLREGKLCMTTLATLAKVLNDANGDEVLSEAIGKTKRQVEQIKARLAPKPVPKDIVQNPLTPGQVKEDAIHNLLTPGQANEPVSAFCPNLPLPPVRQVVLTETLTRRHMTTDEEFEDLLGRARSALSHKLPGASDLEVLKEGLRAVIREQEKRKGLVSKPRTPKPRQRPAQGDDAIPAHVQRVVWVRDNGCCQWPTEDGTICASTIRIQFHHIVDRAKGGLHTPDNLTLLCATHNGYAADLVWGKEWMARFRARRSNNHAPADL